MERCKVNASTGFQVGSNCNWSPISNRRLICLSLNTSANERRAKIRFTFGFGFGSAFTFFFKCIRADSKRARLQAKPRRVLSTCAQDAEARNKQSVANTFAAAIHHTHEHEYTNIRIHEYTNTRTSKHSNTRTHPTRLASETNAGLDNTCQRAQPRMAERELGAASRQCIVEKSPRLPGRFLISMH